MLVALVLLGLFLIRSTAPGNEWLYLFLLGVALCLWLLPRIINLENLGPTLTPSEGVLDPEQLRLQLEDSLWEEGREQQRARRRLRDFAYLVLAIILGSLLALQLWQGL